MTTAAEIVNWIGTWSDIKLDSEISRIEGSVVNGTFESEMAGKMYTVLRIERMRREGR